MNGGATAIERRLCTVTNRDKNVEKILKCRKLWNQFLHNTAECFKDGVVIDGCQVEAEMNTLQTSISKVISGPLVNVSLSFEFTIV